MKNVKHLFGLLFTVAVLTVAVAAQNHSLHDVDAQDRYVSADDGFEIGLPTDLVKKENLNNGRRYTWDFKEGMISVTVREFAQGSAMKTNADIDAYLNGYKETLLKDPDVKFISETPTHLGDYRGESYLVTVDGEKTQFVVLVWTKFNIVLRGSASNKISGSDELVFSVLKTFELDSEPAK